MTPLETKAVIARARQDAKAFLSGYPRADMCPFWVMDEAQLWRKTFDAALLEAKK